MSEFYSDDAIREIQDEMYNKEEDRSRGGYSNLDDKTKFWSGLFIGCILLAIVFNKISIEKGLVIGAIGALILFMSKSRDTRREELTMIECMIRLYDQLKLLQKNPIGDTSQIPDGTIKIGVVGRKQWYDGHPFKRTLGVEFYDKDTDTTENYMAEVDLFTGDITGMIYKPEGVYGNEKKDIIILPTPDMLMAKKRDQYLGQKFYGK